MVITDESIGVSQLLGVTCLGCPPKSMPMLVDLKFIRSIFTWRVVHISSGVSCRIYFRKHFHVSNVNLEYF